MSLDEDLLAEAETAKDVAAALFPFLDSLPDASTEISGIMSELFALNSALRELSTGLRSRKYRHHAPLILEDLDLALPSLSRTLGDIDRLFGRVGMTQHRSGRTYARVWREICCMFQSGSMSLLGRLEIYRVFFVELFTVLRRLPPSPCDMRILRREIANIWELQNGTSDVGRGCLNLAPPVTRMPRPLPARLEPMWPPQVAVQMPARMPYMGPASPRANEAPLSPPTTVTSSSMERQEHWALSVFDGQHSITPFSSAGSPSRSLGPHVPNAEEGLSKTYEQLVELEFDDRAVVAQFYLHASDHRSKLLCLSGSADEEQGLRQSVSSLSDLRTLRDKCCMQLFQQNRETRTRSLWASLRFPTYERLILFHCLFTALKARGPGDFVMRADDFEVEGEVEQFSFKIQDDNFLHALRALKDRASPGVRLEASVLRGELKRTPVWTAFVSELMGSPSWIKRSRCKVFLADLRPYIFCSDYSPPQNKRGDHELTFLSAHDAADFTSAMRQLAKA